MRLGEYQRKAHKTDEKKRLALSMAGLVGETGSIVAAYKKALRLRTLYPGFRAELSEELGDALWYLASIASLMRLNLDEIAKDNLAKSRSLFAPGQVTRFDKKYPNDERLPRKFEVLFTERKINKSVLVKISVQGVTIGDHLTDNTYDPDGYRYHDVFHLAYAAVLGWSPVIRAILKCKRKSKRTTDENEDGARAIAVEEAVSIFIFNHAKPEKFFAKSDSVGFGLLQTVQALVGALEVKECTVKQWERAILLGYEMFRQLKENRGGLLSVDLDRCSIDFHRLPAKRPRRRKTR